MVSKVVLHKDAITSSETLFVKIPKMTLFGFKHLQMSIDLLYDAFAAANMKMYSGVLLPGICVLIMLIFYRI